MSATSGTGTFTQSGGTNSIGSSLYLGANAGSSGDLQPQRQRAALGIRRVRGLCPARGPSRSPAGPTRSASLYLGNNAGSSGTYNLSGSGQLAAACEYVGSSSGTGSFNQSGGSNSVALLSIGSSGTYLLAGGTLQVNGGFASQGIFAGGSTPATLSGNGIIDLTGGACQTLGHVSVSMGPDSLLIVPAGFNTATAFAHYSSLGLTHTAGTTLTVPAGQSVFGSGSIDDFVNCQGTIDASAGAVNLNAGLAFSGTGTVNLGGGNLTVNNSASGISGGALSASNQYVGCSGTGTFTHSAGASTLSNLYLGNNATDVGTYTLNGPGTLQTQGEVVGNSGTGVFTQSAGFNTASNVCSDDLILGNATGSRGTYNLSGTGQLSAFTEYVGNFGTGVFNQSGGTNNGSSLYLGWSGSGAYNLTAGYLCGGSEGGSEEYVGYGTTAGTFNQFGGTNCAYQLMVSYMGSGTYNLTGGTLLVDSLLSFNLPATVFNFSGGVFQANTPFSTNVPMTLGTSGGGDVQYDRQRLDPLRSAFRPRQPDRDRQRLADLGKSQYL